MYKDFGIAEWGTLTPRIEWSYRSEYGTNPNNVPRDTVPVGPPGTPLAGAPLSFGVANPTLLQDDLHIINAGLRWESTDANIAISGGVDNVTDEEYRTFGNYEDNFGWTTGAFDRGRHWYLQATYNF